MSEDAAPASKRFEMERNVLGGLKTRIVTSVALLAGGLAFAILYLAFFASQFAWYQNLAILLVDLIAVPALLVVMWVSWGVGVGRRFHQRFHDPGFP
ncbi:MAG: hypothetical protein L3J73_04710 [Thermoplasmata archaeon]|nr:hypothetical protein [Thermoplasmata archaeon]